MKLIGIIIDVNGKYFVKDKDGNIRSLKVGDKIYEGDTVYGGSADASITIESSQTNEKIMLFGFDEYVASEFGHVQEDATLEKDTDNSKNDAQERPTTTTSHSTQTTDRAVGFQEIFQKRTGNIVNVEASLLDANKSNKDLDARNNDTLAFNPIPTLITNISSVQDNFYDSYLASGTDTINNSFSFEALSGFKNIQIGTQSFNESDLIALNSTPVDIVMQAGTISLNSYLQTDNQYVISYTYQTSQNYLHAANSDLFVDSLAVIVTDVGGQDASGFLSINVIDDNPIAQADTDSIQEGLSVNYVTGNVFTNDHIGADDESSATPVVSVDGGTIGTSFYGSYGELLLKADGTYTYYLDNTNPTVRALVDGDIINEIFTYTIEDGDGDKSSTTLNIEIQGNSETPLLIAQDTDVDESALGNGTDSTSNTETVTGQVIGTANDGFNKIEFIASDNTTITITDLTAINGTQTLTTPQGTLTLTTFAQTDYIGNAAVKIGVINYSYTLNTAYSNSIISDTFDDIISVIITDIHSATGEDDLIVSISDDKPIATNDVNAITEDAAIVNVVSGNVLTNDNDGADTKVNPITAQNVAGKYGQFVLGTDGDYTYTLDNDNPDVDALDTGEVLVDTLVYTITDSDGDTATANLDITINGFTDPNLSVSDVSVVEDGTTGNLKVVFTINSDTTSPRDITFDYTTLDGTAEDTLDYTYKAGSSTITAGSTSTTVEIDLIDDYISDNSETFDLKITNVNSAATISADIGTATIEDDSKAGTPYDAVDVIEDSLEGVTLKLVALDLNELETGSNSNSVIEGFKAHYKVIVVDVNGDPVFDKDGNPASGTVNIVTTDGTAKAENAVTGIGDYDGASLSVEVNTVFSIQTINDAIQDSGETFNVSIADDNSYSGASDYENVSHDTTAVVTTINDGPLSVIATTLDLTGDATVVEDDAASYTLTLKDKPENDFVVQITVTHVDTDNNDVIATTQNVTILAGQLTADFTIDTLDDDIYEGNEDFKVSITSYPTDEFESLTVIHDEVITTIADTADIPEISISDISIVEDGSDASGTKDGNLEAIFTINISNGVTSTQDIDFTFTTSDGTAIAGKDYTAAINELGTITAGTTSTTITISLSDDYFADDGENFNVTIAAATSDATVGTATATATLDDNTGATTDEFNTESVNLKLITVDASGTPLGDTTVNSMDEGYKAYYKVIIVEDDGVTPVLDESGNPASGNVSIAYNTATTDTATAGDDYVDTLTTVGVNTVFEVASINDVIIDDGEIFQVNLVDNSYTNSSIYETVIYETTAVTTTINDGPVTPVDYVYVHLVNNATVDEADGAILEHTLELRLADGTLVALPTGEAITVNLTYTNDETNADDFQTKTTQVVITGDGSSSYNFSNLVADDFLNEVSESYTLSIDSVVDTNSYFEDLIASTDSVTGTISDETTPDTALVSISNAQTITEGDLSTSFLISVDQPSIDVVSDIEVNLVYTGTAIDGTDFSGLSKVTIPAGSNYNTFFISTINDSLIEGSEDFTITIGTITDTNFEAIAANPSADHVDNIIVDDVDANPDTASVIEGSNVVNTPNFLDNDEVGVNAEVTGFTYTDETGTTQDGVIGQLTDTQYGEITLNADGSWTYTSDEYEEHPDDGNTDSAILQDIITYTITDDNSDTASSTLTIDVGDTIATITPQVAQSIDEDDLANGSDTTGSLFLTNIVLGININQDPIDDVLFNQSALDSALNSLKSGGVSLTYVLSSSNHILTASAGATEIFVVTLNQNAENSTYDFELKGVLDHPVSSEDILNLGIPFSVKELGANEDTINGNISVDIVDDIPTAISDSDATVVEGGGQIIGNVLSNDTQGADTAELNNFTYIDPAGANQISTDFGNVQTTATGLLTVEIDGNWTFTPNTYVDHNDPIQGDGSATDGSENDSTQGSFDYTLVDGDGDISNTITQTIHVTDGANPTIGGDSVSIDEDDIKSIGSDEANIIAQVAGDLNVSAGSDPVDVKLTTANSNSLTSDGVAIEYHLSADGYTLTGKAGTEKIFVVLIDDTSSNTFIFKLFGPIDHDDASGENTKDILLVVEGTDIDGDSVTGPLSITVTDDIPSIGTPDDGTTDEEGLPQGSSIDATLTVATGSLAVKTEADTFDTFFDQDTIDTLIAKGIQADNPKVDVQYEITNSGHTLRAFVADFDVFTVDIINPDSTSASYEFNLLGAIDHISAGATETFVFEFKVKDVDGDETSSDFNIDIIDDDGTGPKDITVNEDGSITFGFTADAMSANDFLSEHGTITFNSATNLFTYTPDSDYSGLDVFDLTYSLGVSTITETVTATVNPISDAPEVLTDASLVDVDEDETVALGFKAPKVTDDFDQNTLDTAPNSTDGDNPERLGAITIEGLSDGTTLHFGSTTVVLDGTDITIQISDLDENSDGINDHVSDIGATTFTMTKVEFESMQITPPANSGINLDVIYKVTSYEVDDAGVKLSGVSGETSSENITIDVHAKTDDGVAITVSDINGDEDNWIRIDDSISITKTLDTDGSEKYEVIFDASSLPAGTLYYQGTPADMSDRSIGSDASSGFTIVVSDPDNIPPIYIMTPVNDSNDITNLKVTVNVYDTDADSTPATDTVKSASDYIDITVTPVANDIVVSTSGASGNEDTLIDLNLNFTNSDLPLEEIVSITISDIPDGAIIYEADETTIVLDNSAGGTNSVTITLPTGDTTQIEAYKILPPAHSSTDITLQVSMDIKDFDDDGSSTTDTQTIADVPIVIEVLAVTENETSDTDNDGNNDITQHDSHYYGVDHGSEDTWFDLNTNFTLSATNEDDTSINPYGSETTFVVFTNIRALDESFNATPLNNATIKYNDGSSDIIIDFSSTDEIEVPIEFLDSVELLPPADFAGTLIIDTFVRSQDFDEDTNLAANIEDSEISYLALNIDPVVDADPVISFSQSVGEEDAGRNGLGNITTTTAANGIDINAIFRSHDADGSESFRVFFADIPEDAALFFNGHVIYANSGDDFIADGISVISYSGGVYKVQIDDYDQSTAAKIIPQHNSDVDFDIQISSQTIDTATLADGTVVEVVGTETTPVAVTINIANIADQVINTELRTFDVTEDTTVSIDTNNSTDLFTISEKVVGGEYNAVVQEDNAVSGNGARINLQDIFKTPYAINSYDNLFSNEIDDSPHLDNSVATENVTLTISNLADGFDISGATLLSGTGSSREWSVTLADLKNGSVEVTTQEHFSGEIDFDIQFFSQEVAGNVKDGSLESIKVLVTPVAEVITTANLPAIDVYEDTLTSLVAGFGLNPDDNGNPEKFYELLIKESDVEGKEFTLFYGDTYVTLAQAAADAGVPDVTLEADGYYHFANETYANVKVQYDSDVSTSTDNSMEIKFSYYDYYVDANGVTLANVSPLITTQYNLELNAVTDDIIATTDIDASHLSATNSTDIDAKVKNADDEITFNIKTNTEVTIKIDIAGEDTAGEVNPATGTTPNGEDYDGSEEIVQIRIDGVPQGVDIQDAYYVGDVDNPETYTGIWHIDNPVDADGGALIINGSADYNLVLDINGDNSTGHEISGDIVVSFINRDGVASTQTDTTTIHLTDTGFVSIPTIEIPMDILEWNVGTQDIFVEDTVTKLGDIIDFSIDTVTVGADANSGTSYNGISGIANNTAVTSTLFSITVEGLENCTVSGAGWSKDNFSSTPFYTYQGSGGVTEIQAALDALNILPDEDYNQNHDTNEGDTLSAFNEGPLEFQAVLTTYALGGFSDSKSVSYSGNVTPVTDDFELNATFNFSDSDGNSIVEAQEDGSVKIAINLTSVDDPYLTITNDVTIKNISPDSSGVIVAGGTDESLNGFIKWTSSGGWINLDANTGTGVIVPLLEIDSVEFKLDEYVAGKVILEYSSDIHEKGASTSPVTIETGTVEFDVHPVAEGIEETGFKLVGDEDNYIELTNSSDASLGGLTLVDPTEELSSILIQGVPNGYLVFYGDSHEHSASVTDVDANGNSTFSIDVSSGTVPKIWILPPENIGGVSSLSLPHYTILNSLEVAMGVDDMGSIIYDTKSVFVNISAVADSVTINPGNVVGVEGEDIALNINATVVDTDGSESLTITLTGLGDDAVFKLDGVEIDAGFVTYTGGVYTISNSSIDYTNISKLSFIQNNFNGVLSVTVVAQEISNGDVYATPATDTFNVIVTQQASTTGDDVLFFDKTNGNDGLAGEDTLVFGYNYANESIDFTSYDDSLTNNVEILDLTQHGDHDVIISTTDVEAMTDANNSLIINADAGDSVTLANSSIDTDDVWAQIDSSNVYESAKGANLTINGSGVVIDDAIAQATFGDDVLGYNDTNDVDAQIGDDRLIIFEGVEVDFAKISNIETIDLDVVGDHTISDLKLSEVIGATDHNNILTIFGDSGDNVDFDASDNWVKNDLTNAYSGQQVTEDGKVFDIYTTVNDQSVEVKVQQEILDAI